MRKSDRSHQKNPMGMFHRRYPRLTAAMCILMIFTLACILIFPLTTLSNLSSKRTKADSSYDPLLGYRGPDFNVLVTGGAGFIGSHVVEYFNNQENCDLVVVLDNLHTGKKSNIQGFKKVVFVEGSIEDIELVEETLKKHSIKYIFHLAALISVSESMDKPTEYMKLDSIATSNLLKLAEESKTVDRFILASSAAVYGNIPSVPKFESDVPDCESPYAIAKLDSEFFCQIATRTSKKKDFLAIALRFFNVFGERQDPNSAYAAVIPNFIRNTCTEQKKMTIFGDGQQTRDFVYVKDVVNAMVHMAFNKDRDESKVKKERLVYNVGYERSTTINDLADIVHGMCSKGKGRAKRKEYINYGEARKGDVRHSRASSKKLRSEGWTPKYDFKESLEKTVKWFLKNL